MIRRCAPDDFGRIHEIINAAAVAYKPVIPVDCWHEPYMPKDELRHEIDQGVQFWGNYENDLLTSVMGLQSVGDVALIRHAYTEPEHQRMGQASALLVYLSAREPQPVLVGTWKAAKWAIRFYLGHGFRLVLEQRRRKLLETYWTISNRQIDASVVLADQKAFATFGDLDH